MRFVRVRSSHQKAPGLEEQCASAIASKVELTRAIHRLEPEFLPFDIE